MTKAKKSSNQPNLNSQGRKKITQFNDAETSQSSTPDAILQESLSLKKEIAELKCIIQNLEKEQQNIKNEQSSVEQRTHPTPRPEKYTARDETTQTSETDDMQLAEEEDPFIEKLKYENIRKRKTDSREHETAQDTGGKRSSTQKTYNKTASSPESADRQISAQREVTTPKLHMKTKPPSINIMYQDPKDTIELLKIFKKESKCHRQRPYHAENTSSRPITAVKQRWARLVLGWVTTWEHRMMLSSFFFISLSIFK
ncbi:PREDICTED: RNA polymerase II degradation factor 1-like isoform X3 [Dinoponera quadriceps]|uniref:RNA polymerase II degradation factor 1-like isoform X3 n=1 Tax=Dinoponera quadriceps TaxID=609295 RepID=A0A6P3X5B4_DINQU|nr:PREDICTED: RNA polymerase II degradation factor 1-like isoform X3 [Dinoponera quadriceps]